MHTWGEKDSEGNDICYQISEISYYIGGWLRRWARMDILQYKEKFGCVRVYCIFGWTSFSSITHPGYCYSHYGKVGMFINQLTSSMFKYLNWIIIPIHKKMYRYRYTQAVKKWPQYKNEILCWADWYEELRGLEG